MSDRRPLVLLAQLPIPPLGPGPIRGNVPLAAGYLSLYARRRGVADRFQVEILPTEIANFHGDRALAKEIAARRPALLGLTCYLWNIDRSLWLAAEVKRRSPETRILIGGPEVTADNAWVLEHSAIDFAAIGEGEQTFAELLAALAEESFPSRPIHGLFVKGRTLGTPPFRTPLPQLDEISSPYLEGLLDAADERMMLLETIRGCVYKCKFCYYPKSYDDLYFVSEDKVVANLRHARSRGAREVVLLDPTLNQRGRFADFLELLARENPDGQFTYFGEIRAEGITPRIARLLHQANFTEVEVGLQSVDPHAQALMDRKSRLETIERGVRAMRDEGIGVKIDLIVGLPGDTPDTIRAGFDFLLDRGLGEDVQVFNLSILPGTAFRQEAPSHGLTYQPRPPYYVLGSPALSLADMYGLMQEAQEAFGITFDPLPEPTLDHADSNGIARGATIDLDADDHSLPDADRRANAFVLKFRSRDFGHAAPLAVKLVREVLEANPHTTLTVALEAKGSPASIDERVLAELTAACQFAPSYLDRYYAMLPGLERPVGAKRLVVVAAAAERGAVGPVWERAVEECADLVWTTPAPDGERVKAEVADRASGRLF